ncbi:MAG: transcriptional regulator, partial [Myxococcota bacterium]
MPEEWTDRSLAAACAAGDSAAIDVFEARYGVEIEKGVAKLDAEPAAREELAQQIRERLFVGETPKLASYDGRGDLLHWLRVVVVRMRTDFARSRGRAAQRTTASADAGVSTASPADDPEFAHLKAHYGSLLGEAIEAAMVGLPEREREVLRL